MDFSRQLKYLIFMCIIMPGYVLANVQGQCANCHVMHASESGTPSDAMSSLVKVDCVGCHTGVNTGTFDGTVANMPFVLTTSGNALAGGDFQYANTNDRYGHNPSEIGVDTLLTAPPGWETGTLGEALASNDLTCAGTYGCHGSHDSDGIRGSHHNNATGSRSSPGSVGESYRFLSGIEGYEDDDYEYETNDYNIYKGQSRSDGGTDPESSADVIGDTSTISSFCAQCHGIFHSGASSNKGISDTSDNFFTDPWIRHPVDISMPVSTGEYAGYNRYSQSPPDLTTPLASVNIADQSLNMSSSGDRIVMCLSCHRAHASPYYAMMRFDYRGAGSTWTNGCAYCHTEKN